MKKVLVTAAALGLVFGVAANALALDQPGRASEVESTTAPVVAQPTAPGVALWSVAGQWVLAGAYLSNGYGAPGGAAVNSVNAPPFVGPSDGADAFYIYSFKVLPTLQINDKIAMKGEYRIADRGVLGLTDLTQDTNANWYTVYMEWTSPIGKTRFGRTPAGAWGTSKWNNSTRQGQRLMLWLNMMPENWGTLLFTEKLNEQDAGGGPDISDQDRDAYYVDLSYKADFGKTVGAFWVVRDARDGRTPSTSWDFWANGDWKFGDISVEWELDYAFGEASDSVDRNAFGMVTDVGWKTGDWKLGGLFIYGTGDTDGSDGDAEAIYATSKGTGRDYNPYQIMMGDYMNLWNADNPLSGNSIHPSLITDGGNAGLWSLGGYVGFAMSPQISLSGEVGYFAATDEPADYDSEYGWEIGVGMSYKLMDNLNYNLHFSYLMTGDYFKQGSDDLATEDIYLVANALSMSF